MKVEQKIWMQDKGWNSIHGQIDPQKANLVLYFGDRNALIQTKIYEILKTDYPNGHIVGCSTGGEIIGPEVHDGAITTIALELEQTAIKVCKFDINNNSLEAGINVAKHLNQSDLRWIFTLSDGMSMNGTDFVRGIASIIGKDIPVTGGLAGDGDKFQETIVGCDDIPKSKQVVAVGFYGDKLRVGVGSMGGWSSFGPERLVTRSEGNTLYELDGKPALDLYKKYLGDMAHKLPSSALLFPLAISKKNSVGLTVRTILSIDESKQSMTFAGDIPQGYTASLMKGNSNSLVFGAENAAQSAFIPNCKNDQLAILISCIGRKLLMGQRVGDEVEAVQGVMGQSTPLIGFYSYGELSPHDETGFCELHNQTMTITTLSEI